MRTQEQKPKQKEWTILARHKWVEGCVITESDNNLKHGKIAYRRFTATIRGFKNWKIYEGFLNHNTGKKVQNRVIELRDRIDKNDQSVFNLIG